MMLVSVQGIGFIPLLTHTQKKKVILTLCVPQTSIWTQTWISHPVRNQTKKSSASCLTGLIMPPALHYDSKLRSVLATKTKSNSSPVRSISSSVYRRMIMPKRQDSASFQPRSRPGCDGWTCWKTVSCWNWYLSQQIYPLGWPCRVRQRDQHVRIRRMIKKRRDISSRETNSWMNWWTAQFYCK